MDGLRFKKRARGGSLERKVRMTVFRGRALLKMDPKGRLSFPLTFRDQLVKSKAFVVTNSVYRGEPHLDLFASNDWLRLEKRIAQLPGFDENVQAYQRFYMASGTPVELDSQGRFLVPQILRDYAKLQEDIVLVGMGSKIELWALDRWDKIFSGLAKSFEQIQQNLSVIDREKKT